MLTLFFRKRKIFQCGNVRGVPFLWNYVEICHCLVSLTCLLFVTIHVCQCVTLCYWSLFNMLLFTAMQATVFRRCMRSRSPVFFQCTELFIYPPQKEVWRSWWPFPWSSSSHQSDPGSVVPNIRQWREDLPHWNDRYLYGILFLCQPLQMHTDRTETS